MGLEQFWRGENGLKKAGMEQYDIKFSCSLERS
jgi:hypothetical protein